MGLILCPTARTSEIRFEPPVSADQARRWEASGREAWAGWEARFRAPAEHPPLTVGLADVSKLPGDLGRTRGGRIELNASLPREAADATFRHELAHVFLESRCAGFARTAPLLSEAFALFASGDAARRLASGGGFPTLAAARDGLTLHGAEVRADSREAARSLVRVLAQGGTQAAWETWFTDLLGSCTADAFSSSRAFASFLDVVRGAGAPAPASRTDFLLLDGHSGEVLAEDGRPGERFPAGSILKPSLVAAVPGLMEPRPARDDAAWRCPGPPRPGEAMSWQAALTRSCNGFFLDFAPPEPDTFAGWEDGMRRLGLPPPPATMEGRIGLLGDYALSPREVARLFAWLDRSAPHVVDALRGTATDGTLAGASESAWFASRGISLKTGTVRDVTGEPRHAWIVAVGPRSEAGAPSFVAALHATGRATSSLLPDLKRRLSALTGFETPAEVQILGLVPPHTLSIACEAGAPLAVRRPDGAWRLEGVGASRAAGAPTAGETFACPGAALVLSYPTSDGSTRTRIYRGTLRAEPPPPPLPSSVPLRARSARARAGSRFILGTSVLTYTVSSVLSEAPSAHAELQAALSLVVRNDRLARRHGDRPPCDTTHCNLFGQDERVHPQARARTRAAVASVAGLEIAPPAPGPVWLAFSLGGRDAWTQTRTAEEIRSEIGLPGLPTRITKRGEGNLGVDAGSALLVPCETFRNQLQLPSCPDSILRTEEGFVLSGAGEGHGVGLDVTAANAQASLGADFRALLVRAYPGLELRPATGASP